MLNRIIKPWVALFLSSPRVSSLCNMVRLLQKLSDSVLSFDRKVVGARALNAFRFPSQKTTFLIESTLVKRTKQCCYLSLSFSLWERGGRWWCLSMSFDNVFWICLRKASLLRPLHFMSRKPTFFSGSVG